MCTSYEIMLLKIMTSHILYPFMLCPIQSLQRPLQIRYVIIPHFIGEETKFQRGRVSFHGQTAHNQQCWDLNPGLSDFGVHGLSAGLHWDWSVVPVGWRLHLRGVMNTSYIYIYIVSTWWFSKHGYSRHLIEFWQWSSQGEVIPIIFLWLRVLRKVKGLAWGLQLDPGLFSQS